MTRHWCGPECGYCQDKAERRKAEADEPLSSWEESRAADAYERSVGL